MSATSNNRKTALRVGILGTGTMGAAIARSLLRSGFPVTVESKP